MTANYLFVLGVAVIAMLTVVGLLTIVSHRRTQRFDATMRERKAARDAKGASAEDSRSSRLTEDLVALAHDLGKAATMNPAKASSDTLTAVMETVVAKQYRDPIRPK